MLPLPGYFPASATQFSICVPPSACPGVDVSAVRAILKDLDLGASGAAIDDSAIGPVMAQFFMYHSLTNGSLADSGLVSVRDFGLASLMCAVKYPGSSILTASLSVAWACLRPPMPKRNKVCFH